MKNVTNKKLITVGKTLVILSSIITPVFVCLQIVNLNSDVFVRSGISDYIPLFIEIAIIVFLLGLILIYKNKNDKSNKKRIIGSAILVSAYIVELAGLMLLIYSDPKFKNWLINSAMSTFNYQHLANMLYNDKEIKAALNNKEIIGDEYQELFKFDDIKYNQKRYANKYEEAILTKDKENDSYKIIKISGTTLRDNYVYEGYLAVIYDPTKVKVATSSGAGTEEGSYGEALETIAKKNNAKVAINAGGFYDPEWNSNGGIPHGLVFSRGEFKSDYTRAVASGGIIGFDEENRLVLRNMTQEQAIESGIRDCVDFGPFLIINGINQYEDRMGHWGIAPRTAIGQRKDGIVLFLVIDGRQENSIGADMDDLADILYKYGAYNAANLDGGTSTALYSNGQIINVPHNGVKRTIRRLPNAFILEE